MCGDKDEGVSRIGQDRHTGRRLPAISVLPGKQEEEITRRIGEQLFLFLASFSFSISLTPSGTSRERERRKI